MTTDHGTTLRNWSTPITIGAFLITGLSGVFIFFHVGEELFHDAHQWLGLALVVGGLLHIVKHWKPFTRYFKRRPSMTVIALLLVAATGVMAISGHEDEHGPVRAVMHNIEESSISALAALQHRQPEELRQRLTRSGFRVASLDDSPAAIAAANGTDSRELVMLLFDGAPAALEAAR